MVLSSLDLSTRSCRPLSGTRRFLRHFSIATFGARRTPQNATTMTKDDNGAQCSTPILLLKTKSTPNDGYEEQFSAVSDGTQFEPTFVPVLEHQFLDEGLNVVKDLLRNKQIGKCNGLKYGGMIFTSQRAVEAFARLVEEGQGVDQEDNPPELSDDDR